MAIVTPMAQKWRRWDVGGGGASLLDDIVWLKVLRLKGRMVGGV